MGVIHERKYLVGEGLITGINWWLRLIRPKELFNLFYNRSTEWVAVHTSTARPGD